MDWKTKYIIVEDSSGIECPILFPEFLQHNDIKNRIDLKVVSAGFVSFGFNHHKCELVASPYGESISLKVKSRPEDKNLIEKFILGKDRY